MEISALKDNIYNVIKDFYISSSDDKNGMLDLASMQRVFLCDGSFILVSNDKISVLDSQNQVFQYYLFDNAKEIFKSITMRFDDKQVIITFTKALSENDEIVIKTQGALMEKSGSNSIGISDGVIGDDLISTLIAIQKTGYAFILNINAMDRVVSNQEALLSDVSSCENKMLATINGDLSRRRTKKD